MGLDCPCEPCDAASWPPALPRDAVLMLPDELALTRRRRLPRGVSAASPRSLRDVPGR